MLSIPISNTEWDTVQMDDFECVLNIEFTFVALVTISKSQNLTQIKLKQLPDALLFIWNLILTLHSSIDLCASLLWFNLCMCVCGRLNMWKFQNTMWHSVQLDAWWPGVWTISRKSIPFNLYQKNENYLQRIELGESNMSIHFKLIKQLRDTNKKNTHGFICSTQQQHQEKKCLIRLDHWKPW